MSDDIQAGMEAAPVEEVITEAPEAAEPEAKEEAPKPKDDDDAPIPKGVQKRIDRAVRRQYEAEAEAKYLREQLQRTAQEMRQEIQQTAPQESEAPRIEQFQTYEDFLRAQARYEAKREIEQTLIEHNKRLMMEKAQAEQRKTAESWSQKVAKTTAELPDFADVVGSSSVPMPEHVKQMVLNSEQGPKLAYYLATHPDEAEQIANQHPLAAIRALVRIEDTLEAEKSAKKATDAPPPITPVGTKTKSSKSPAEMTQAEFNAWRKSHIKSRH